MAVGGGLMDRLFSVASSVGPGLLWHLFHIKS